MTDDDLQAALGPGAGGDEPASAAASGASKWDRYFADLPEFAASPSFPATGAGASNTATAKAGANESAPSPDSTPDGSSHDETPDVTPDEAAVEAPRPLRPQLLFPPPAGEEPEDGDQAEGDAIAGARQAFAAVPPPRPDHPTASDLERWERMFADLSELAAPVPPPSEPFPGGPRQFAPEPPPTDFPLTIQPAAALPAPTAGVSDDDAAAAPPAEKPARELVGAERSRVLNFERTPASAVGASVSASADELRPPPPPPWVVALKEGTGTAEQGDAWRNILSEQPAPWRVASAGGGAASMALPGVRASGEPRVSRSGAVVRSAVEALEVLALALLMFVAVRSIAQNFVVDGGSMEPTFANGEMLVVNKLAYRSFDVSWLPWTDETHWQPFGKPQGGDVVVFRFPQNPQRDFIKRIIATEGQTVEVRSGVLMVDGVPRQEPYLSQPVAYEYGPITVPDGQVFVLGDNRNNSYDSHSWGTLERQYLIGRAELRYWPLGHAGRIDHSGATETPAENAGVALSPSTAR